MRLRPNQEFDDRLSWGPARRIQVSSSAAGIRVAGDDHPRRPQQPAVQHIALLDHRSTVPARLVGRGLHGHGLVVLGVEGLARRVDDVMPELLEGLVEQPQGGLLPSSSGLRHRPPARRPRRVRGCRAPASSSAANRSSAKRCAASTSRCGALADVVGLGDGAQVAVRSARRPWRCAAASSASQRAGSSGGAGSGVARGLDRASGSGVGSVMSPCLQSITLRVSPLRRTVGARAGGDMGSSGGNSRRSPAAGR